MQNKCSEALINLFIQAWSETLQRTTTFGLATST